MKKYKIELTEEQLSYISRALRVSTLQSYHIHGERLHKELLALLNEAEPIQEKVWLPFTTLKDGGTYLSRNGKEFTVRYRGVPLLMFPFGDVNWEHDWTNFGYFYTDKTSELDLVLELQPYEEQTGEAR